MSLNCKAQPVIRQVSPAFGPIGAVVTLTGTGFSRDASDNIVFFGATRASVTAASATSLSVVVPAGATYQPISVTVNGLTGFSAAPFVVTFAGGQPFSQTLGSSQQDAFEPEIDSSTGLHPNGVAIADFDGDGKPDIAAADNYSELTGTGAISVLRNTGSVGKISFTHYVDLAAGFETYAIAEGDLDGDGKPDLVSTSVVNQSISVYRNISSPGSISFASNIDYSSGQDPFSVAIADLDLDGRPDVIVANYLSGTLSIYRNISSPGSISLASPVTVTVGFGPESVAAADLDGDGKLDLAVSNGLSNTLSILRNTSTAGSITFASPVSLSCNTTPTGLAIGDLDGDGKPDIAVVNNGANNFSIFQNSGSPGSIAFAARTDHSCGASPYGVAIADLNGDGKPDIYISSDNASVTQNASTSGTIAVGGMIYLYPFASSYGIGIADIDGDGKSDLIEPFFTAHLIAFLRNKDNEPTILSFSPANAVTGSVITITGHHLDGATAVSFGGIPASSFTITNADTILATVGNGASGSVGVSNQYGTNYLTGFVFHGPPVITRFTPEAAGNNDTIQLYGSNFTGVSSVSFGGMAASSFSVNSDTSITAVVDSGSTGVIQVITPYGTGTIGGFVYDHVPVIGGFTPYGGGIGTTITISGAYFNDVSAVTIGGAPAASYTVTSPNSITAMVGEGASGYLAVTSPGGSGLSDTTFAFPPPVISSISPDSATIGTSVTIQGTYFRSDTSADVVYFGAARAVVTAATTTSLTVTVPEGATYEPVSVIVNNRVAKATTPFIAPYGKGGASFNDSSFIWRGAFPANNVSQLALVDVDGDGKSDVVASDGSGNITVLQNTSSINHPSFAVASNLSPNGENVSLDSWVAVGDINGDGKPDIVTVYGESFLIYLNTSSNGQLSFAAAQSFPTNAYETSGVALADFDGDGRIDIAIMTSLYNAGTTTLSIYRNTGDGTKLSFAPAVGYGTVDFGWQMQVADFDRDGKPDIAVVSELQIDAYRNSSTPGNISFSPSGSYKSNLSQSFAVADVNGDGLQDLISVGLNNQTDGYLFSVLKNTSTSGSISFAAKIDSPYTDYTQIDYFSPVAGLVDGDGKPDVVVPGPNAYGNGPFSLYRNTGSDGSIAFETGGHYTSQVTFGWTRGAVIGDIDGDGKADIVVANDADNVISVFRNQIGERNLTVCTYSDTAVEAGATGGVYQWQTANGSDFVNLVANDIYSGVNSSTLRIQGIPDSLSNSQFRCLVDGIPGAITNLIVNPDTLLAGTAAAPAHACSGDAVTVTFTAGTTVPPGSAIQLWTSIDRGSYVLQTEKTFVGSPLNFSVIDSAYSSIAYFFDILPQAGASSCMIGAYSDTVATAVTRPAKPMIALTGSILSITNYDTAESYAWQRLDSSSTWVNASTAAIDTLSASGTYRVQATESSCMVHSDSLTYIKPIVTGLPPDSTGSIISYPNPTTGLFVIDSLNISDGWITLEIIDGQIGRRISIYPIVNQTRVVLSLGYLSDGIYMAVLRRKNGQPKVIRFLKM
jgi:hypothetical protein